MLDQYAGRMSFLELTGATLTERVPCEENKHLIARRGTRMTTISELRSMYVDLLNASLRNEFYRGGMPSPTPSELEECAQALERVRSKYGDRVTDAFPGAQLMLGLEPVQMWPLLCDNSPPARTLLSRERLDNVQSCIENVLRDAVPGDLMEAGVWKGGTTIFMRGVLKAHGVTDRKVWVVDSFAGLPSPDPDLALDDAIAHELLSAVKHFSVSLEEVRANFASHGLLDEQVVFLKGWFKDTLPGAPVSQLALLRLDGDYYESTRDALESMYPKVSVGGYIIIDDYGQPIGCRQAVDEYRREHGIEDVIERVDEFAVFWRRTR